MSLPIARTYGIRRGAADLRRRRMRNHIGESGRLVAATAGELPRCGLDGTAMDNKIPRSLIGRIRHQKGGKSCRSHSPASFIPSRLPVVRASSPRSGARSSPVGRQTRPKPLRSARRRKSKRSSEKGARLTIGRLSTSWTNLLETAQFRDAVGIEE